ncbi:MAG: family 20 glycosylhydrolase [Verrucomicrobiota bacterium]
MNSLKNLIPLPQQTKKRPGKFSSPKKWSIYNAHSSLRIQKHLKKAFSPSFQSQTSPFQAHLSLLTNIPSPLLPHLSATQKEEAYHLEIDTTSIRIYAQTERGIFYGLQTLQQLLSQGKALPCCVILDWPDMDFRGTHLTLGNGYQPPFEKIQEMIPKLASFKLNQFFLEYDGSFSWDKYPFIAVPSAFTKDQCRSLIELAQEYFIEVIPTLDSLGHQEHYLKHPSLAHLRELPTKHSELCPQNPKSLRFIKDLWREILEVHHDARHVNITGDEVFRLGDFCPRCKPVAEKGRIADLFFNHYDPLSRWMLNQGHRPMMWHDMLSHYPQRIKDFSKEIIVLYWNYYGTDSKKWSVGHGINTDILPEEIETFPAPIRKLYQSYWQHPSSKSQFNPWPYLRFFKDQGFDVIGASGGSPMIEKLPFGGFEGRIKNTKSMAQTAKSIQAKGMLHTFWSDDASVFTGWTDIAAAADYAWKTREEKTESFLERFDALYVKSDGAFKDFAIDYDRLVFPDRAPNFEISDRIPSLQEEQKLVSRLKNAEKKCKGDSELLETIAPSLILVSAINESKRWAKLRLEPELGKGVDTIIDLSKKFNGSTRQLFPGISGNCLDLQGGIHTSRGVKLKIHSALEKQKNAIILRGAYYPDGALQVHLPIQKKKWDCLYFWHTGFYIRKDQPLARYEMVYEDGKISSFPIIAGVHVSDWNRGAEILPSGLVAWQGFSNAEEKARRMLYMTWWKNPRPDVPLVEIRLISAEAYGHVAIVGITGRVFTSTPKLPNSKILLKSQNRVLQQVNAFEKNHNRALQKRCVQEDRNQIMKQSFVTDLRELPLYEKKSRLISKQLLTIFLFAFFVLQYASGVTLFNENFDSGVYTDNAALPIGTGKINSGYWSASTLTGAGTALSSTTNPFSGTRSLALNTPTATDKAQVSGFFGSDSNTAATPTSTGIDFKMSFNLTDVSSAAFLFIRDSGGNNMVFIQIGNAGQVSMITPGGVSHDLHSISANTWYTLDIKGDSPLAGTNTYTTTLLDSTGTIQLGSYTGAFQKNSTTNDWARFLILSGQGTNLTDYFDNISVVAVVPEPSFVYALSFSLILMMGFSIRKKLTLIS